MDNETTLEEGLHSISLPPLLREREQDFSTYTGNYARGQSVSTVVSTEETGNLSDMVKTSRSRRHSTETERASSNVHHASVFLSCTKLAYRGKKDMLVRMHVLKETSSTYTVSAPFIGENYTACCRCPTLSHNKGMSKRCLLIEFWLPAAKSFENHPEQKCELYVICPICIYGRGTQNIYRSAM